MLEVTVDSIRVSLMNYQRVVILKEKSQDRYLPIWIGPAEADAIAVRLQEISVPRPLTHDLLKRVIETLGARLNFILVNDLKDDTFYARLFLRVDNTDMEVDCRPSDALALAVRAQVPIFVEESVLDKAGIYLDKEGKPLPPASLRAAEASGEIKEEEMKKLKAFQEFIQSLNLDDLGKGKEKS
ncbi:MAG TPA: bifunctional nuclease family protein [Dehalococcoidia bacterium]|nr:bifunctional nuclease family protein [Dehalococcoidia bacterium]